MYSAFKSIKFDRCSLNQCHLVWFVLHLRKLMFICQFGKFRIDSVQIRGLPIKPFSYAYKDSCLLHYSNGMVRNLKLKYYFNFDIGVGALNTIFLRKKLWGNKKWKVHNVLFAENRIIFAQCVFIALATPFENQSLIIIVFQPFKVNNEYHHELASSLVSIDRFKVNAISGLHQICLTLSYPQNSINDKIVFKVRLERKMKVIVCVSSYRDHTLFIVQTKKTSCQNLSVAGSRLARHFSRSL